MHCVKRWEFAGKSKKRKEQDTDGGDFTDLVVAITKRAPGLRMAAGRMSKPYVGMFATNLPVDGLDKADEIFCWGRRRWNIEGGFRVEKHGGFGLEHTFCNDDTAGRNYHVLMQIAYTLWQVFDTGVLSRLSEGCRKPTREMWAKLLFLALLVFGLASVPKVAIGAFRMRRYHLVA